MNTKQRQSIIDAAPDGAEYYSHEGCYYRDVKNGSYEYCYSKVDGWHENTGHPEHRYFLLGDLKEETC